MSEAPDPLAAAALEGFAYQSRPTDLVRPEIDAAEEFHEASKIAAAFPGQALGPAGRLLARSGEAPFALGRKALVAAGPGRRLPPPAPLPVDLVELAHRRRSELPEPAGTLRLDHLGTLLALSLGPVPGRPGRRATPSAGAMYPLDLVVVAMSVASLAPGAHVYDPIAHALRPRGEIDPLEFHAAANGPGGRIPIPSALIAVVATFARTRVKYGLRGYRFALMEAGHVAQAALTTATALGLAALPCGGFPDAEIDARLELDGLQRACLYLVAVSAPSTPEELR